MSHDSCLTFVFVFCLISWYFLFCFQIKSKEGNGTLVPSTGDRRCVMTVPLVIEARVNPSPMAARMDKERYHFNKLEQDGVSK